MLSQVVIDKEELFLPTRSEITRKVVNLFSVVSYRSESQITEETRLQQDLLLSSTLRGGLAHSYTAISKHYGGARITILEARELATVRACIDLLYRRATRQ